MKLIEKQRSNAMEGDMGALFSYGTVSSDATEIKEGFVIVWWGIMAHGYSDQKRFTCFQHGFYSDIPPAMSCWLPVDVKDLILRTTDGWRSQNCNIMLLEQQYGAAGFLISTLVHLN